MLVTAASLFILGTTLYNYREGLNIEISRVRSEVDGKTYLVQNTLDKQEAADQLAYLRQRMKQLKEHIREKHRKRKIPQLVWFPLENARLHNFSCQKRKFHRKREIPQLFFVCENHP